MSLIQPNTWLPRKAAAVVLREAGLPVSESTLTTCASKGTGPQYRIINGRACYRREWLDEWVKLKTRGPS